MGNEEALYPTTRTTLSDRQVQLKRTSHLNKQNAEMKSQKEICALRWWQDVRKVRMSRNFGLIQTSHDADTRLNRVIMRQNAGQSDEQCPSYARTLPILAVISSVHVLIQDRTGFNVPANVRCLRW